MIGGSIQFVCDSRKMLPVNLDGGAALGVFRGVLRPPHDLRSRDQQFEAGKVAARIWQVRNRFFVQHQGDIRTVGLKLRNLTGNRHGFCGRTHIQLQIHLGRRVGRYSDALALCSTKSGCGNRHVIDVRNQVLDGVLPNRVGGRLDGGTLRDVFDSNRRVGDRCSRTVGDLPIDRSINGLSPESCD